MKKDYISVARHKVGGMMTIVKEALSLLSEEVDKSGSDEQKNYLRIAKINIDRAARLARNYFFLQKMESGVLDFEPEEGDLNEIVRKICEKIKSLASERAIDITLELDDKLPKVRFDNDTIIVLLEHLVENAINFTEKGSVLISTSSIKGAVQLSVTDTGCGIEESDKIKLFQPFEKLQSKPKHLGSGEGLGLFIAKRIVEKHDGEIRIESLFNKGTTVIVTLPA